MRHQREIMLRNAVLWTRTPITKIRGGMHIRDGKIVEIFNQERDSPGEGSSVDLKGMHVIPGLIDAHQHFFLSALLRLHGDASTWKSKNDALGAIEAACKSNKSDSGWVFFSGMDHSKWETPSLPRLKEIDGASLGLPVVITDISCHSGIISTEAFRRSGINRDSLRFPTDIDINRNGTLKGTIWEEGLHRVILTMFREILQRYSKKEKRRFLLDEATRCLSKGLTHVHDPGIPSDVQILLKDAQKYTPLKISWSVTAHESLSTPPRLKDDADALTSDHAPKSVKFYLDGAHRLAASMPIAAGLMAELRAAINSIFLGNLSQLHLLNEQKVIIKNWKIVLPYLRFGDTNDFIDRARVFTDKGYRVVIHALGNVAARQAAEAVNRLNPVGASVEHMLVMGEEDLDLFARCGAVASIQPGFMSIYAKAIERQGVIPYLKTFAIGSLLKRSVPVCISSDGPCGPTDPLYNMRRAVDRKKPDGSMLDPDERTSEEQALIAATIGGSRSLGIKNDGLCEGAPATFCIVDGDPFSESSLVVQTWIDGKKVY